MGRRGKRAQAKAARSDPADDRKVSPPPQGNWSALCVVIVLLAIWLLYLVYLAVTL